MFVRHYKHLLMCRQSHGTHQDRHLSVSLVVQLRKVHNLMLKLISLND